MRTLVVTDSGLLRKEAPSLPDIAWCVEGPIVGSASQPDATPDDVFTIENGFDIPPSVWTSFGTSRFYGCVGSEKREYSHAQRFSFELICIQMVSQSFFGKSNITHWSAIESMGG